MGCAAGTGDDIIEKKKTEVSFVKKWKWLSAWLVQIAEMLAEGVIAACTDMLHPVLFGFVSWAVMPVLGMLTACINHREPTPPHERMDE
jgi:hypothetical protein